MTQTTTVNTFSFKFRPFDPIRDQKSLETICADVYGGTDYLPSKAKSFASDSTCSLMVLADETDDVPLAVANCRRIGKSPPIAWIEAVRTSEKCRRRGLGRKIVESLMDEAREKGCGDVLSCTVTSNAPMLTIFSNLGMKRMAQFHVLEFSALLALPGWKAKSDTAARPLLQALGIDHMVSIDSQESKWAPVTSEAELTEILQRVKQDGGCGYLPGLYKITAMGDTLLQKSLREKKVFTRLGDRNACFAFLPEEQITSLRSKWVCAVAATTEEDAEAALWHACSPVALASLDSVAFTAVFDGAVTITPGSLTSVLPLTDDPFVLYGRSYRQ